MLKLTISFMLLVHGLINFAGFAKAFDIADIPGITADISKPMGIFFLIAASLFIASSFLCLFKIDVWRIVAVPALVLSQYAIFMQWHDARYGTILNVTILLVIIIETVASFDWKNP